MGIAQHDPRAHPYQLVDKEEPGLEHLLEHQQHSGALGGRDDGGGHDVGRKSGPGSVLELGHVATEVGPHPPLLPRCNVELAVVERGPDSQAVEPQQSAPQVLAPHRVDGKVAIGDGRQPDEAADFDVVRPDGVRRGAQRLPALDGVQI